MLRKSDITKVGDLGPSLKELLVIVELDLARIDPLCQLCTEVPRCIPALHAPCAASHLGVLPNSDGSLLLVGGLSPPILL